jgi:hypothetical protein
MIRQLFLLGITLISGVCDAQINFERVYGGALPDFFHAAIPTSDGGILAGGSTRSYNNGSLLNTDFYLVKMNASGDTLWQRAFGSTSNDDGIAVAEFAGGYVIGGTSINPTNGTNDFYIVKTDLNGIKQWDYYYGGTGAEFCLDLLPLPGDTLLVYGSSSTFTNGGYDIYLFKIDGNGTQLSAANFGGTGNDGGYGIRPTADGGYIFSGFSNSGLSTPDIYLVKTDSSLTQEWTKSFGGAGFDIGYDVEQNADGGFMILGLWENGADTSEIVLIKTDAAGQNAVYSYPGTHPGDFGFKMAKTIDGFFITGLHQQRK